MWLLSVPLLSSILFYFILVIHFIFYFFLILKSLILTCISKHERVTGVRNSSGKQIFIPTPKFICYYTINIIQIQLFWPLHWIFLSVYVCCWHSWMFCLCYFDTKLQHQNRDVNTLNTSALVNKMGGSFAKIGTIDYLCWIKIKMFLLANRNVSHRE